MFKGSMVALVTPMDENGSIDLDSLQDLVEWHIESGTKAIIVAGTTGESATLDPKEHRELVTFIVKQVAKRIPVIAGTGTNSTKTSVHLAQEAESAGADACLVVTPYYNKPTQNGLYAHFKTIAESINIPIILYNVPGRTACDLLADTVFKLSKIPNIIGIKEATGKVERAIEIKKLCHETFQIYSGDDVTALDLMLNGAAGVISVTANISPEKMNQMCEAIAKNDVSLANTLNNELDLLHRHLFLESNPIPAKWALNKMGKIKNGIRLPLLPLDEQYHAKIKEAMQSAGVVYEKNSMLV